MKARASIGLAVACVVVLAACGQSDPESIEPTGAYAVDIALAQENATSDFERDALSDGVISTEEYDEAHQLWLACMEDQFPPGSNHAVSLIARPDGLYEFGLGSPPGTDAESRVDDFDLFNDACSRGTIELIAPLYNDISLNPENLAVEELIFACLERDGLLPEGYSERDFADDWNAHTSGGDTISIGPLAPPLAEDVVWCIGNPG